LAVLLHGLGELLASAHSSAWERCDGEVWVVGGEGAYCHGCGLSSVLLPFTSEEYMLVFHVELHFLIHA